MSSAQGFVVFPASDQELTNRVDIMRAVQVISGSISCIASIAVALTVVFFPSMWKSKIYMKMIVMISICDAFVGLAFAFGFPTGALCTAQGAMIMFFSRASWMWSCFMLFQLHYLVKCGKIYFSFHKMNILVLVFNLVLGCLPFTTKTYYGESSLLAGHTTCSLHRYDPNYFLWLICEYVLPLTLTTAVLIVLSVALYRRLREMNSLVNNSLVTAVILYPTQILITSSPLLYFFWAHYNEPAPTADNYDANTYLRAYTGLHIIYGWLGLQGLFNCVIFFHNSAEARIRWRQLLYKSYVACRRCVFGADCGRRNRRALAHADGSKVDSFAVRPPATRGGGGLGGALNEKGGFGMGFGGSNRASLERAEQHAAAATQFDSSFASGRITGAESDADDYTDTDTESIRSARASDAADAAWTGETDFPPDEQLETRTRQESASISSMSASNSTAAGIVV